MSTFFRLCSVASVNNVVAELCCIFLAFISSIQSPSGSACSVGLLGPLYHNSQLNYSKLCGQWRGPGCRQRWTYKIEDHFGSQQDKRYPLFSFTSYPVESSQHALLFSGSKNGYTNCTGCNFSCKMLLNILLHGLILVRVVVQAAGV